MPNSYYNHGTTPATNSPGASAPMRAEFDAITTGFALLPTLAGNGNKIVAVNAGGTALTVITSIDGIAIGQVTPAAGSFTTLTATGSASFAAIDNTPIGQVTPAAGKFTTLVATGATTLAALTATGINSSPIGQTTAAAGKFTTLLATSLDTTPIGQTTPAAGAFTTLSATGATTLAALTATGINSSPIGQTTAAAGKFTTLVATGATTLAAMSATSIDTSPIGQTTPAAGGFTTINVTGATVPVNGMYLPAANTLAWATNTTRALTLTADARLGLGGTPTKTWTLFNALTLGNAQLSSIIGRNDSNTQIITIENGYYNAGFKYASSAAAGILQLLAGGFSFSSAAAGTVDTAITFANRLQGSVTGAIQIGPADSGVVALTVNGVSGTHSTKIADSATNSFNAGYLEVPQNIQNGGYTAVLADSGKHIYCNNNAANAWVIPANASVAYPIGTTLTFVNDNSATAITVAITTDTMVMAPGGATGTRTIAASGRMTALKVSATRWQASGAGVT